MAFALTEWSQQEIHIVGLSGIEGFTVAKFLFDRGVRNLVLHDFENLADFKRTFLLLHHYLSRPERKRALDDLLEWPVKFCFGTEYLAGIAAADRIFLGQNWFAYPANQALEPIKASAPAKFYQMLDLYLQTFPGKVIGVTGTNGKSTTVDLIAKMLHAAGKTVWYGGNERSKEQSLLRLEQAQKDDYLVLEVSNRHLKFGLKQSPQIAVITNVTPNHIPDHGSFEAYAAAKQRILEHQDADDYLVLNADDSVSSAWATQAKASIHWFATATDVHGGHVRNGQLSVGNEAILPLGCLCNCSVQFIANAAAAVTVAHLCGIASPVIATVLREYQMLPGRCEQVAVKHGVKYIYDIKSTVPQATVAALQSFTEPVVLIAGGEDKGVDYALMAGEIQAKVKWLILLPGTATAKLLVCLRALQWDRLEMVEGLPLAFIQAAAKAEAADVVLLSPGAAGFYSAFIEGKTGFRKLVDAI